jgi:hypothetical protein
MEVASTLWNYVYYVFVITSITYIGLIQYNDLNNDFFKDDVGFDVFADYDLTSIENLITFEEYL